MKTPNLIALILLWTSACLFMGFWAGISISLDDTTMKIALENTQSFCKMTQVNAQTAIRACAR